MLDGEWEPNAETIKVRKDGVIIDGQHRLLACVQSGVTIRVLFVTELGNVHDTVDTGTPRNSGDALYRRHFKYSSELSAASRIIAAIEDIEDGDSASTVNLNKKRTNKDVIEIATRYHDHLVEGCQLVATGDGKTLLKPKSVFIACFGMFASRNRKQALEFMHKLTSGEDLSADDPAKRLRSLLLAVNAEPHVRRKRTWLVAVTIKTWNAHLQEEKVRQLRFSETERWPKIRARK